MLKQLVNIWIPILVFVGTLAAWVDIRYMRAEISDQRHIDLQILVGEMALKEYEEKIDNGEVLTAEEAREYALEQASMGFLLDKRKKLLGL